MLKKGYGLWGVRWSIHHLERKWSWSLRQKIVNASVKLPTSVTLRLTQIRFTSLVVYEIGWELG